MKRDDVLRMANEAGMNTSLWNYGAGSMAFTMGLEGVARGAIERFAAVVAAAERDKCAKLCEQYAEQVGDLPWTIAATIRARKDDE